MDIWERDDPGECCSTQPKGSVGPIDPADVYFIEAREGDTLVRLRFAEPVIDIRRIDRVAPELEAFGFLGVHREFAVNLDRIRLIRRRDHGRDWEVVLDPPVNKVIPVSRNAYRELMAALNE